MQFVRHEGEAKYPSLWRGVWGAWAPSLRREGVLLHDFTGRHIGDFNHAESQNASWGSRYKDRNGGVEIATGTENGLVVTSRSDFPLSELGVTILYRKTDSTDRGSVAFGYGRTVVSGRRCDAHIPWSDGTVYFNCGNLTDRATYSWTSDTDWHVWTFTQGPRNGAEVWFDGELVGTGTQYTRQNVAGHVFMIGSAYVGAGVLADNSQTAVMIVHERQPTSPEIQLMASDPYAFFRRRRRVIVFSPALPSGFIPYPNPRYAMAGGHQNMGGGIAC